MSTSSSVENLWDLQKPHLPPRSRLFHLPPIGIGSLFVESLMGYIVRLADYHCVSPRRLILREIVPHMVQNGYFPRGWHKKIQRVFQPNSPLIQGNEVEGALTVALIQALEELTLRQDVSQLAILRQATSLLAESQLRRHQAWCPICLKEWQQAERVIYTPLIWLLQDLQICLQHRDQALVDRCPHCQQAFPPLTDNSRPGYCPKCHEWLGVLPIIQSYAQSAPKDWEWKDFFPDPLERQLLWLDDSEELLSRTEYPFLPPKNPLLGDLSRHVAQMPPDAVPAVLSISCPKRTRYA
jgi:TniQ